MFVANILANLDGSASKERKTGSKEPDQTTSSMEQPCPSILALQIYESSDERESDAEEEKRCKIHEETNPLSHLADVSAMKDCKDQFNSPKKAVMNADDVLVPHSPFKTWNFGLA
jgi:hypothetical protein